MRVEPTLSDLTLWIDISICLAVEVAAFVLLGAIITAYRYSPLMLQLGWVLGCVLLCVGGVVAPWIVLRMIRRTTSTRAPSPGWHADPDASDQVRYWDGYVWTDHAAPHSDRP